MPSEDKAVFSRQASDGGSTRALQSPDDENVKSCWVCFATEADDRLAAWVQPCKCIGTTKWVSKNNYKYMSVFSDKR